MVNNNEKESIFWKPWRMRLLEYHLLTMLILFEIILSIIFFLVSYFTHNIYFKGVGVGLVISWATGGIAYLIKNLKKE